MKEQALKAEFVRRGRSIPQMACEIGISESALYRKLRGDSEFSCREIKSIIQILELPEPLWIEIFFEEKVS